MCNNDGAVGAATAFTCDGADFDGTNDYVRKGSALSGAVDGKQLLLSKWLRLDGGDGATQELFNLTTTAGGTTRRFGGFRNSANRFSFIAANAAGTTILNVTPAGGTITADGNWHHFAMSIDLSDTAKRHIYLDGADISVAWATYTDDSIDFDGANDCQVGVRGTSNKLNGCMAELFFHTAYLDLSVAANREKFRSSAGKPVSLGADGSTPLGVQPLVYLRMADGAAATTFANNLGSGGGPFTITGTLDTASTSPSD